MEAKQIAELRKQAKEYEGRLRQIIRTQESNLTTLEKKVLVQRLRNEVIEEYGSIWGKDLNRKIDEHINTLKQESIVVDTEDDSFDLKDVIKDEYNPNWLVLGLLSRGSLYFFAARAKAGKTDFVNYLVRCILSQNTFLSSPCINGNVLWYHLEESKGSIQMKAKRHGYREMYENIMNRGDVTVVRSLDLVNDFSKLERQVNEVKPVLVVIDTVRAAMARSGLDERNANYADIFYQVQALAIQKDVTIICLHHTIKKNSGGEGGDVLDSMSGTSKMSGIGEGTIIFERAKEAGSTNAYLHFITRDIGRKKLEIARQKTVYGNIEYKYKEEHGVNIDRRTCAQLMRFILDNENVSHTRLFHHFVQDSVTQIALESLLDNNLLDYYRDAGEFHYRVPEASRQLWRRSIVEMCRNPEEEKKELEKEREYLEALTALEFKEPKNVPPPPEIDEPQPGPKEEEITPEKPKAKFNGRIVEYDGSSYSAIAVEEKDNEFWYKLRKGRGTPLDELVPESKLTGCTTNNITTTKPQ